jgi:membrane-bound serine protease (ClpP class)
MFRSRITALALGTLAALLVAAEDQAVVPPGGAPASEVGTASAPSAAVVVKIPLPLSAAADARLKSSLDRLLKELPASGARPVVIFEFRADEKADGYTGDFEPALALARYLASDRFQRVRTIAYVPTTVEGHAVLAVLACEEIIIAPQAQLGVAGRGETSIGPTMETAYREIAERRRTIPVPVVLAMLDPARAVFEVQLVDGGRQYVSQDELETLRAAGKVGSEKRVNPEGELLRIPGQELRLKYGFASHLAEDRKELAAALQIPPDAIRDETATQDNWRALRVDIHGTLGARTVDDVTRAVRAAQADQSANLLCVWIKSPGGEPAPSVRLVDLLAQLDARQLRSVSFVEDEARSVAAVVALVCDEAYATPTAILGGSGDTYLSDTELADLRASLQEIAAAKQRDWSPLVAMIDPDLDLFRYRHQQTGVERYLCEEEHQQLQDAAAWQQQGRINVRAGVTGAQAREYGWLRGNAETFESAMRHFNLPDDISVVRHNPVVAAIEQLGAQPWFARTLLFIAFFALISEASAPGIGVAGFISGTCFLLFFWSQFLNGTAGWLELILFLGGLACIGIEIFVVPGLGIFGVGGGVMVLLSIVLASQTFVFPRTTYQFERLSGSMFTLVAACGGVVAALWIMRRYLADSWLFSRVMLPSPAEELDLDRLESLVDWNYLEGKRGVTTTPLTPSGKAKFGDDVVNVISDGLLVAPGTSVRVIQVLGNRVVVEPLEER